ncbi:hypothetical protein N9F20_00625 [Candidatus Pelagibacter sp.]|nr:hypothetical protein [Candidatus Pelagibacter sp.]
MIRSIYLLLLFCLFTTKSYSNSLYYGGFSFGTLIPEKTYSYLLQENKDEKFLLSKIILKSTQEINNDSFKISYDLLENDNSEDDQNVLVFALDNEYINHISIPEDKLTRTDIVLNFNIIIFNAKNNFLVASIPLEISKTINSQEKLSKNKIVDELKKIYINDVSEKYRSLLSNFNLKNKYNNRIGITKVIFEDNAKKYIEKNFDKKDIFIKNRFAKSFGSFLAFNNNIAVVPYKEDRTSNTIRLTYQDATKDIKIPSPDYQIHLTIRGFKSVLFKESNVDSQWIYGSYINVKIIQPELEKTYFDENIKNAINVEFSKRSIDNKNSFEWIFFNDSLKILFDQFSLQTVKLDKKWLKSSSKNKKISKKFKKLNEIYIKCK